MHDHVFRAGQLLDLGAAAIMVEVGMTDQQNLDITEAEPQFFNALAQKRNRSFEIAVDQDVSLRRRDQVSSQPAAATVVNVADHAIRRKRLAPLFRIRPCRGLREGTADRDGHHQDQRQHELLYSKQHIWTEYKRLVTSVEWGPGKPALPRLWIK